MLSITIFTFKGASVLLEDCAAASYLKDTQTNARLKAAGALKPHS